MAREKRLKARGLAVQSGPYFSEMAWKVWYYDDYNVVRAEGPWCIDVGGRIW